MFDEHRVHHIEPVAMRLRGLAVGVGLVPTSKAPAPGRGPGHTHTDATNAWLVNAAGDANNVGNVNRSGKAWQHVLKIEPVAAATRPGAAQPLRTHNKEPNLWNRHPTNCDGDVLGVLLESGNVFR